MNPDKKSVSSPSGVRKRRDSKNNEVSKPGKTKISVGGPKSGIPQVGGPGGPKMDMKQMMYGQKVPSYQPTMSKQNSLGTTSQTSKKEENTPKKKTSSISSVGSSKDKDKKEKSRKKSLAPEPKEAAIVSIESRIKILMLFLHLHVTLCQKCTLKCLHSSRQTLVEA